MQVDCIDCDPQECTEAMRISTSPPRNAQRCCRRPAPYPASLANPCLKKPHHELLMFSPWCGACTVDNHIGLGQSDVRDSKVVGDVIDDGIVIVRRGIAQGIDAKGTALA
jgi:hypothetical protein